MAIPLNENDLFAVYSLPGETDYKLIKQESSEYLTIEKFECIPHQQGFIIHPFQKSELPSIVILADVIEKNIAFTYNCERFCDIEETKKEDYIQAFRKAKDSMNSNKTSKVVLSRTKKIDAVSDIYSYFVALVQSHPQAFVFFYNIPGVGSWIGASPEVLLSEKDNSATTVALAGTKRIEALRELTEKEREEQNLVEVFFEDRLEQSGIFYEKNGPSTVEAGTIAHLKTEYRFNLENRFLEMADLFHPSPAISGTPQQKALNLIEDIEVHNRKYYCGYLGPYDITEEKSLFINLRSMEIFKDACILYIGGGLTIDSELESEWQETENKAETLNSIVQKT